MPAQMDPYADPESFAGRFFGSESSRHVTDRILEGPAVVPFGLQQDSVGKPFTK